MGKNKNRGRTTAFKTKNSKTNEEDTVATAVVPIQQLPENSLDSIPLSNKATRSVAWKATRKLDPSTMPCARQTDGCMQTAVCILACSTGAKNEMALCQECQVAMKQGNLESATSSSARKSHGNTKNMSIDDGSRQVERGESKNVTGDLGMIQVDDPPLTLSEGTEPVHQLLKNGEVDKAASDVAGDPVKDSEALDPETTDGNEEDTNDIETWDLAKIFSVNDILGPKPMFCSTDDCRLKAAVGYVPSNHPNDPWYSCVDCQDIDFGGWDETEMRKHPPLTEEQEKVFRAHCSARSDVLMPSDYVNTATNDDDSLVSGGMDEETWDLVKILSVADVTGSCPVVCQTEGCGLKAGVIYVSSSGLKWYGCLDCQDTEFEGFPEQNEMTNHTLTAEQVKVLRKHCSKNPMLAMPAVSMPKTELTSPPPNDGKNGSKTNVSHVVTPLVTELEADMPVKNTSKAALELHRKWQQLAEKMGGPSARIVVEKSKAKQLIFDVLHDTFAPMNITQIHTALKAVVPSPVLKTCLEDMAYDGDKGEMLLADSDDDEERSKSKTVPAAKKQPSNDQFAGSLIFKPGRNPTNNLYFVDQSKQTNQGNGLAPNAKNELYSAIAQAENQKQVLQEKIGGMKAETIKLLREPTNEEISRLLDTKQEILDEWQKKAEEARQYQANAKHKEHLKRRLAHMTGEWRKRRRICLDFLTTVEEMTEGTIRRSECLAGNGAIEIESDETYAKNVTAYHKKKKSVKLSKKAKASLSLSDDSFIAVRLDSQGCVERIYADAV